MHITFRSIHTWLGILSGAIVCVISVTGSLLVFRQSIEDMFGPQVGPTSSTSTNVSLDDVATRVLFASHGKLLTRIKLPSQSHNSYVLTIETDDKHAKQIVVDAATGRVVGELNSVWMDWLFDLHRNLLSGRVGRKLVGGIGIMLFITGSTGIILSLLRKRRWHSLTTVRVGPPWKRFHYELHRSLGIWSYAFLALQSFTGIGLAYPEAFRSVFGKPQQPALVQALRQTRPATPSLRPLDEYLRVSNFAVPNAELTELRLPESVSAPVMVRFRLDSDLGEIGRNQITLEAGSGRILAVQRLADQPPGIRVQQAFTPIHYGEMGGILIKLLWSMGGLAPCVLFVTGLFVWIRIPSRHRGKAASHAIRQAEEVAH